MIVHVDSGDGLVMLVQWEKWEIDMKAENDAALAAVAKEVKEVVIQIAFTTSCSVSLYA